MKIGVIGGSGIYDIDGIQDIREERVETPYGAPSDNLIVGRLGSVDVVFLPRHGKGHRLMPSELNHRANIFALKKLGVSRILSVSAVGSFREEMAPGDVVLVDQFVDRTKRNLAHTFFGNGIVAHVGFAHPTCDALRAVVTEQTAALLAEKGAQSKLHGQGTYVNMEGPAFSTLAESRLYKSWGMDIIGMTNLAEAKLAREAELCYLTIAMVTDYDCWHPDHDAVSVEMIIQTLLANAELAKEILKRVIPALPEETGCECGSALATAIITRPEAIPQQRKADLAPIIGKYIQ